MLDRRSDEMSAFAASSDLFTEVLIGQVTFGVRPSGWLAALSMPPYRL